MIQHVSRRIFSRGSPLLLLSLILLTGLLLEAGVSSAHKAAAASSKSTVLVMGTDPTTGDVEGTLKQSLPASDYNVTDDTTKDVPTADQLKTTDVLVLNQPKQSSSDITNQMAGRTAHLRGEWAIPHCPFRCENGLGQLWTSVELLCGQ